MEFIHAVVYGLVQGLTEFLPISSSGHLVILHSYFPIPVDNEIAFDVALHAATLLAVSWYFRRELRDLVFSATRLLTGRGGGASGRTGFFIILATIPAALAGYFGENYIEDNFRSVAIVAFMLALVGILIIAIERFAKKTKDLKNLTWRGSLLIGLAQALALIPGTSRSGITIVAGMALGLQRKAAVTFSFLLSVPIIAGASLKNFFTLFNSSLKAPELVLLGVAFISAALAGWLAIKYLLRFAEQHSLRGFGYYRLALAAILVILLYFR